jgi:hypothetical protein
MSVLSTLALLVTTAAVKSKPKPDADASDKVHPRFIAGYDAGLKDGRLELDQLTRERDDWRARAEAWRERAEARPIIPLGGQHSVGQLAQQNGQAQALLSQMAQAQRQASQQAQQAAYQNYGQGLPRSRRPDHCQRAAMRRPMVWTPEMLAALRNLRARGTPLFLCAERIGVGYSTAVYKARELGLAGRMNWGRVPGAQRV